VHLIGPDFWSGKTPKEIASYIHKYSLPDTNILMHGSLFEFSGVGGYGGEEFFEIETDKDLFKIMPG